MDPERTGGISKGLDESVKNWKNLERTGRILKGLNFTGISLHFCLNLVYKGNDVNKLE